MYNNLKIEMMEWQAHGVKWNSFDNKKKYFLVEKKEIGELYKNVIQGSWFTTLLG